MTTNRRTAVAEARNHAQQGDAQSRARRGSRNPNTLKGSLAVGGALVTTIGLLALRSGGGTGESTPSGVREGGNDNVPAATAKYLESRPTKTVTIEAGEGTRAAAYGVDPQTVGASTDLEAGVKAIVDAQVGQTESGKPMPQAGEQVEVPNLPNSIKQVPPAAR